MDFQYYAEMKNSCGCVLDITSANTLEELRINIISELVPYLEAGDTITIIERD